MCEVIPILISKDKGGQFVKAEDATIEKVNQQVANTITCHEPSFSVHHCNMCIVAMRGRNPDNPSDRTPGVHTEQRLEPNTEGLCNTLTTVQKDNLVLENNKIEKVGQISNEGSQCGTVVSPNGLYPTISAGCHGYANPHIAENYRIRKLTPRECFRLMNVEEEQFNRAEKVVSSTQLYKIAGNAIVVSVLCAIFSQLNIQEKTSWDNMDDNTRYNLVFKGAVKNAS